ncbi:hypothetical protein NQ317_017513 [Molorchus minor]|uniref:Uncharacterized protein n=1 Tax=Molorchus minor TaxID=1323400 RepID=A0ABQ9JPB0_9CUCU|nr:hypothetical protein NQ317_017513 [Molorchus minor]
MVESIKEKEPNLAALADRINLEQPSGVASDSSSNSSSSSSSDSDSTNSEDDDSGQESITAKKKRRKSDNEAEQSMIHLLHGLAIKGLPYYLPKIHKTMMSKYT